MSLAILNQKVDFSSQSLAGDEGFAALLPLPVSTYAHAHSLERTASRAGGVAKRSCSRAQFTR